MKSNTLQYVYQFEKNVIHNTLGMVVTKQPLAVKLRLHVPEKKCGSAIEAVIATVTARLHKSQQNRL